MEHAGLCHIISYKIKQSTRGPMKAMLLQSFSSINNLLQFIFVYSIFLYSFVFILGFLAVSH